MDIKLVRELGTEYVTIENCGTNGRSNKVFCFLEDCRKRGITQRVLFGRGPGGQNAINYQDAIAFMDRAGAEGLKASFR